MCFAKVHKVWLWGHCAFACLLQNTGVGLKELLVSSGHAAAAAAAAAVGRGSSSWLQAAVVRLVVSCTAFIPALIMHIAWPPLHDAAAAA